MESFPLRKHLEPVDEKYNGDESFTHPIIAMREAAEKQQEEEEIANHKKGFQSEIEKLEEERKANKYNKLMEDEHEVWIGSKFPKDGENN